MSIAEKKRNIYTFEEYEEIIKNSKSDLYEFINGEIIKMFSPTEKHQDIVGNLFVEFKKFFKGSKCKVMVSPFDVLLSKRDMEEKNVVIPDISIMCENNGFDGKRYTGVPDIIVEVTSSSKKDDTVRKMNLYARYGVLEYWIIEPNEEIVTIYSYNNELKCFNVYPQESSNVQSRLFNDLTINIADIFD